VPSLGSLAHRFLEAGSFRVPRIMCARAASPGVLSNSSWACRSNAQWRCLCRAGVMVGAIEANVNHDCNSLHLLLNCRITVSIAEYPLTWSLDVILMLAEVRLGTFGSPLPVGRFSRKTFWYFSTSSLSATTRDEYLTSSG